MSHDGKLRIYDQFARIGKALAAPSRLELIDLILQGERPVDALAREAHLSVANASQHLQVLHAAKLIESRRQGQHILYRIADPVVERLWIALRDTARKQLADLEQVARDYLEGADDFAPIERKELARRIKDGTVTLIDVRPREEYEQGHLPGAISVPVEEIDEWARSAPRRRPVVAYCRGPFCVYAVQAVAKLRKRGLQATRSEDGVAEWRGAGLPVERAAEGSA
jgi:rhodanese-related sulfurtransferase